MSVGVKICGLSTAESIAAAVAGGARYVGFVFFDRSPRRVTPKQAAALAAMVPPRMIKVALTVDAEDRLIADILAALPVDLLQLHGEESPDRCAAIRRHFGRPVMKAIKIAEAPDLAIAARYEDIVDRLLFDAKPAASDTLPGGNARAFDWRLLTGRSWRLPWMLAGGLDAGNLAEAVRVTGADEVDVSSGVESSPGIKDRGKIRDFLDLARTLG